MWGRNRDKWSRNMKKRSPKTRLFFFWTGRIPVWQRGLFLEEPYLTSDLAEFLVERKTRMVGFDSSSPDRYPYDIHRILFRGGCFIAENLTGLENLSNSKELEIFAIPLKIHADSSIARIFAAVKQEKPLKIRTVGRRECCLPFKTEIHRWVGKRPSIW